VFYSVTARVISLIAQLAGQAFLVILFFKQLRDKMARRGLEQSKKFSWEKTAELTLQVYKKVVGGEN
jgi:glycosyltransferase involved in cell wall biosynthesis